MTLERPWEMSHARYNPVTGAVYSDPVHARAIAAGWDVDGWLDRLLRGPLAWSSVYAEVRDSAELIRDAACADVYHSCAAHEQRASDLVLFLHSRLSRLAGEEVADCPPAGRLEFTGTGAQGPVSVDSTPWGPGFVVDGEHFCHGVLAWAPSTVSVDVPAGTLSGAVGIHDWNAACGDGASFAIAQAGVTLWSSAAALPYGSAQAFSVAVDRGPVSLTAAAGASSDCDAASWLDLRVE